MVTLVGRVSIRVLGVADDVRKRHFEASWLIPPKEELAPSRSNQGNGSADYTKLRSPVGPKQQVCGAERLTVTGHQGAHAGHKH